MLEIDGSVGEGGGQVLRTALSIACVKKQPVHISRIRAGRGNPGLRAQHLTVCRLLAEISGASMQGAELGSTELVFEPGDISCGNFKFDIGTAGSCTLLLQAALPVMLCAKENCKLEITGGTHVRGAPTFEYFSNVFLPAVGRFGADCGAALLQAGFYPKGGGSASLVTRPSKLSGAEFGSQKISAASYAIISGNLPAHVAKREESEITKNLAGLMPLGKILEFKSASPGNAITIWSGTVGTSSLGEMGKSAEAVAKEACETFKSESAGGAAVDSHLADQLLLYAALAEGRTTFTAPKITSHLSTNAMVLRQMSGRNISLGSDGSVEVV